MAYQKINWQPLPNKTTPVNDDNLKHMDQGIYDSNNKSIIMVGLTDNVTINFPATAWQDVLLNFDNIIFKLGDTFTLNSDGTIGVNKDGVRVKVTFGLKIGSKEYVYPMVYANKNGSWITTGFQDNTDPNVNANLAVISNLIVEVNKNDFIRAILKSGATNSQVSVTGTYQYTYMIAEEI